MALTSASATRGGAAFAVLGFRTHTYWTAVVAVAGRPEAPRVIARRRFEFAAAGERFAYHRAAQADPAGAASLIAAAGVAAQANAASEIETLVAELRHAGVEARLAAAPANVAKPPDTLAEILRSHSRIHTAEGNFYRNVVASAAAAAGLQVSRVVERELPALVCDLLRIDRSALETRLMQMGAALGPPWSEDQKLATMAAWLHLEAAAASQAALSSEVAD